MQVNFFPAKVEVAPAFVHVDPALTPAVAVVSTEIKAKNTAVTNINFFVIP